MRLIHTASSTSFHLCPGLLWLVGNVRGCDVHPPSVRRYGWRSSTHAEIWMAAGRWWVQPLAPAFVDDGEWRDPVYLDGDEVHEAREIPPGAAIGVEASEFRAELDEDDRRPEPWWVVVEARRPFARPVDAVDALAAGEAMHADALVVLAEHPDHQPRLREVFRAAARSDSLPVRGAGLRGLAALAAAGVIEARVAQRALDRVGASDPLDLRMDAARALASVDALGAAPKLLTVIREALAEGTHTHVTTHCARLLVRSGESLVVDELVREATAVAADASARKRRALAARVLAELVAGGEARALRALRALIADPHDAVRLAAVRAAASAGEPAVEALVDALVDDEARVREEALSALSQIASAGRRVLERADAVAHGRQRDRLLQALDFLTA